MRHQGPVRLRRQVLGQRKRPRPFRNAALILEEIETYSMSSFSRPTLKKPFSCILFMTSMN